MTTDRSALRSGLARLRERYRQTSLSNITAIEQLGHQLSQYPTAPEVIDALRRELHRLRGTAGTYGFLEASDLAEELEQRAVLWAKNSTLEPENRGQTVVQYATQIRQAIVHADDTPATTEHATEESAEESAPVSRRPRVIINELPFASPLGLAGSTVLVLDDDPLILELTTMVLTSEHVRVIRSSDPANLWELLERTRPALLLLDMQLGDADGISLTRAIRARAEYQELPIIIVSATTSHDARQAAYDAGADGFVGKPLVADELRARASELLAHVRVRRIDRGLHPTTGLPQPTRTLRDADAAFTQLRTSGQTGTLVLIHPVLLDGTPQAMTAWFQEIGCIARAFGQEARLVGHVDDLTIMAVLGPPASESARRCEAIHTRRSDDAPDWRAAVVDSQETGVEDPSALRKIASDLLSTSPGDTAVIRWRAHETNETPEVIIVEDDPALADMLEYAMRAAGISYRVYTDGMSAVDAMLAMPVRDVRPVVLLDVNLPGVDGHSLNERLRVERPGVFSVVFVTVRSSEADQVRALRAGAIDYLAKPINLRILMAKLPLWLGRAPAS